MSIKKCFNTKCLKLLFTFCNSVTDYMVCTIILHHVVSVAPITQYTHVRNEYSNTQGSSPNVVKVIFHTLRNCSLRKEFASSRALVVLVPIFIMYIFVSNLYIFVPHIPCYV